MNKECPYKIIAGIDPSLRATGVVIIDSRGEIIKKELIRPKKLMGVDRLIYIKKEVLRILKEESVSVVGIEGFSFGSFGRSTFDLGGLGWIIRVMLNEEGFKFFEISPSSLKSFIIKGNADKSMMMEAVFHKYGIAFDDDNLCDAFSLSRMIHCLGDDVVKFSVKGGAQKLKKLREKLEKEGIELK